MLLPTSLVGSYARPEWLIGRIPPRVRAKELWRVAPEHLAQARDDATELAIRAQERAGLDLITDAGCPVDMIAIETARSGLDLGVLPDLAGPTVILGVLDPSTPELETADTVAARVRRAYPDTHRSGSCSRRTAG